MKKWFGSIVLGLFLLYNPIYVMGQDIQSEIDQIAYALAQGRWKDGQILCDTFFDKHTDLNTLDLNYVKAMRAMAIMSLGHYDEGALQLEEIEQKMQKELSHSSQEYIDWLTLLSSTYSIIDESRSLKLMQKIIDFYDEREDYDNEGYIMGLLRLGLFYDGTGMDCTVTIDQILNRVFPLIEKNYGLDNDMYALALMLATNNAEAKHDAKKQLQLADKWINLQNNNLANNAMARFLAYRQKLRALVKLKQYDELHANLLKYTTSVQNDCMNNFLKIPANERMASMNYVQGWYFNLIPGLLEQYTSDFLTQKAYDGLLFAKGLMQILEVSKDKNDDVLAPLKITWKQVQKALKPDEAAVEFVCRSYTNAGFDFHYYQAFVVRPGYIAPHIVQLGFYNLDHKDIQEQCNFFWVPLKEELANAKTIYFSPHGKLHNLPAESIVPNELKSCNFYRLSSTRQIVLSKDIVGQNAVVYGGLVYDNYEDIEVSDIATPSKKREAINDISFLEGSEAEANMVANVIDDAKKKDFKVTTFTGHDGTEDSFRTLSGKNLRVIHLATHGFYYQEDELIHLAKMMNSKNEGKGTFLQLEDRPLSRSGLILSGANFADLYGAITTTPNDGILTAQEVSELNFSGLDLIVLSACETGMGKIGGDGVFGLQRGFKKAGAQSILMSLWQVDDEATCLLMTEFYRNWIGEEKPKHEALELAKKAVRSHKEKGWDDPKYWAAFILLDGLD